MTRYTHTNPNRAPRLARRTAAFALISTILTLVRPATILAHEDLPGPPALDVRGYIGQGTLVAVKGQGLDNEPGIEEWDLWVKFDHVGHAVREITAYGKGSTSTSTTLPFRDIFLANQHYSSQWETKSQNEKPYGGKKRNITFNANELRYTHTECSPRNKVMVFARLKEKDVDEFGRTFLYILALPLPRHLGTVYRVLDAARGDEDYGSAYKLLPKNGKATLKLRGKHGGADIPIEGKTSNLSSPDCKAPVDSKHALVSPDERAELYVALASALDEIALVAPESGNPSQLSPAEVDNLRRMQHALILDAAELAAGLEVESAVGLEGGEAAVLAFESGQAALAEGLEHAALEQFQVAFLAAATAAEDPVPSDPMYLDRQLSLLPEYVAVRPNSSLEIPGAVLGLRPGDSIFDISVEGQQAGMSFDAVPAGERNVLALSATLGEGFEAGDVVGLGRLTGGAVQGPDPSCPVTYYGDSFYGGIFIDERGPFANPDPTGCGFGEVIGTALAVPGGTPTAGASFEEDGIALTLELANTPAGTYQLEVTARLQTSDGERELSAPLTLVVEADGCDGCIFADGFESGGLEKWSF